MFECEECGGSFKTKSGLISHQKAKHPSAGSGRVGDGAVPAGPTKETVKAALKESKKDMLAMALKGLGIKKADVMAHKVYGDRVVIIEGPVGYKRVYLLEV